LAPTSSSTRPRSPMRCESQVLGERSDRSMELPSAAKDLRSSGDDGLRAAVGESRSGAARGDRVGGDCVEIFRPRLNQLSTPALSCCPRAPHRIRPRRRFPKTERAVVPHVSDSMAPRMAPNNVTESESRRSIQRCCARLLHLGARDLAVASRDDKAAVSWPRQRAFSTQ
jgi:hypothetical protein